MLSLLLNNRLVLFVITFIGSFVGQLFVRIFWLDGSLNKWWLLFPPVSIPPVSFIPAYLIFINKVYKGYGGYPVDLYMFLPLIFTVVADIAIDNVLGLTGLLNVIGKFIINLFIFLLAFYLRSNKICSGNFAKSPFKLGEREDFTEHLTEQEIYAGIEKVKQTVIKEAKKKIKSIKIKSVIDYILNFFNKIIRSIFGEFIINFVKDIVTGKKGAAILCAFGVMAVLPFMEHVVTWIPYLSTIITTIGNLSPILNWITGYVIRFTCIIISYILANMIVGDFKDNLCNVKLGPIINSVLFVLVLSIHIIINYGKGPLIEPNE